MPGSAPKRQKRSPKRVAQMARVQEYFNLRAAGFTLAQIAARFNVSFQAVSEAIGRIMDEIPSESAERYRMLVTARLERTAQFFEREMRKGPQAERLNAGGRFVRTQMELAKLHGCYAEITMPVTQNNIQQVNVQQNETTYVDLSKCTEEQLERYSKLLAEHAQFLADVAERNIGAAGPHPQGNGASGNGHAPQEPPRLREGGVVDDPPGP